MATINPYLNFMGNTEEAFLFYKSVFGGEFRMLQRFKDTPERDRVSAHEQEKIMHVALPVGGNLLMGTDALKSMGHVVAPGSNMSISIDAKSEAEATTLFNALAAGGKVSVPMEKMFWGAYFGLLTDKFGIQWMVNYDPNVQQAGGMKTIENKTTINAPKETVWNVLTQDAYTRTWYAEFSEGAYAKTSWQIGDKVIFTDPSGNGLIGKIVANKPAEELSITYTGLLANGNEDYDSAGANAVKGGRETYRLSGTNGTTQLATSCDMDATMFDAMSASWERALQKIKSLAETAASK